MLKNIRIWVIGACVACPYSIYANSQHNIRLNQVGFYPNAHKYAIVENKTADGMAYVTNTEGDTVLCAPLKSTAPSPWTGNVRYLADLSALRQPGHYTLHAEKSCAPVTIGKGLYRGVSLSALKFFYLMRSGIDIEQKYAGEFARKGGHPDTVVFIHPAAASPQRPAYSTISSPKGWYDAGDYNKYVVNSAFSIGLMLAVYEQILNYFKSLQTNIPESNNQTPDLLDEVMFNLQWLLTMQDPIDGGVYHKLTTPQFEGFVMPTECKQQRFVVAKSITATLDFAAVMAQAAKVFKKNKDYPDFSAQAEIAARKAYSWALKNPDAFYLQSRNNQNFTPAVHTGEYGDNNAQDEFFWASTQLFLLTGDDTFQKHAADFAPSSFSPPTWGSVSALGTFAWLNSNEKAWKDTQQKLLNHFAINYTQRAKASSYNAPFGSTASDYGWGCLAEKCCAPGISLLFAHPTKFLHAAIDNADCLFGRNATGFCYITGFGQKSPQHPHHRISEADRIQEPFPGMLIGGPNPAQQDLKDGGVHYPSSLPDESYTDQTASYASNEIAINWNASLVAFICWIDALMDTSN